MNDQAVACLMFGIYNKDATGMIDRQECAVCHGDRCPYIVEDAQQGVCAHCFGTGLTPAGVFELRDGVEDVCSHCQGSGRIQAGARAGARI